MILKPISTLRYYDLNYHMISGAASQVRVPIPAGVCEGPILQGNEHPKDSIKTKKGHIVEFNAKCI